MTVGLIQQELETVVADRNALQRQLMAATATHEAETRQLHADKTGLQAHLQPSAFIFLKRSLESIRCYSAALNAYVACWLSSMAFQYSSSFTRTPLSTHSERRPALEGS